MNILDLVFDIFYSSEQRDQNDWPDFLCESDLGFIIDEWPCWSAPYIIDRKF